MGWSGGTFSRVHDWTTDAGSAINIEASRMDAEDDNFATGINTCLTKDGQNSPTANLPMGGNRHTGVGNAAALTDYASAADVIDNHLTYYVTTGSSNAYVLTPSPSIGAYAEGQILYFRANHTNTGASTLNVNSLGAIAIEWNDGTALSAGDITLGEYYAVIYDANDTPDSFKLLHSRVGSLTHDGFSDFVADEHVAHSGVSVIAASGGLAASNNDLSSNIGLSVDVSTLTEFGTTGAADLDVDYVILDDGGTEKKARVSTLITPEIGTTVTGTTDTLAETDFGKLIQYSNTGTVTITLPDGLKTGFWAVLQKTGASGTTSISATTTLNTPNGDTDITTQYNAITVFHLGSNVWTAWGGFN